MSGTDGVTPGTEDNAFPSTIQPYIGAVIFESFLYGFYSVLFLTCVLLLRVGRGKIHWTLQLSALTMFLIASADIGYTMWLLFGKLLTGDLSYESLRLKYYLYVTNNVLADSLLLYRCYVVWNYQKRILVGPAILLVAATVCGYIMEGSSSTTLVAKSWVYLVMTTILNAILTILTASRIWYVSRRARKSLDSAVLDRYNAIVSIIIESGLIYCVYMVVDVALHTNPSGSIIIDSGLIQVVGIMPTLILAQVALGRTVQDAESIRMTQIGMDTSVGTTAGKRSDTFLKWKTANASPWYSSKENFTTTQDHDQDHYLHFSDKRNQVKIVELQGRSKPDELAQSLADDQRVEVDFGDPVQEPKPLHNVDPVMPV